MRITGLLLLGLAIPAAAASAQAGSGKTMTSDQRIRGQARLDSQVTDLYDVKLPPLKRELRDALTAVRDTLLTARGHAERLLRAHNTGSSGVVLSMARALRSDCEGTAEALEGAIARTASMHTSAELGDKTLAAYREAATRLRTAMTRCAAEMTSGTGPTPASSATLAREAGAAAAAMDRYTAPTQDLLRVLEMMLLPKGYVPRAAR